MSKTTKTAKKSFAPSSKTRYVIKPVTGSEIAAIVLDELSKTYSQVCNYQDASILARDGHMYLALLAVEEHNLLRGTVVSPLQHWVFHQALSVLKKQYDPHYDRWPETARKWFTTERRVELLNRKFLAVTNRRIRGEKSVPFSRELYRFYEGVLSVLGNEPPVDEIAESAHYGPGSTQSVRGSDVGYHRKMEANECTPLAVDLAAKALIHDKASWAHLGMDPVYSGNPDAQLGFLRVAREWLSASVCSVDTLMFIHKNMTALRSISAQPTCSGMLQLGVHAVVAPRLIAFGVDISDQSKNRKMARQGSWEEKTLHPDPLVTLDKSDASSFLARDLVTYLFPPPWAKLLMKIRTPSYQAPPELGGQVHRYSMYAGMGNGTTFVIETLVFWAMVYATSGCATVEEFVEKCDFAVYGDDVILRRSHAHRYIQFAEWMGFVFNKKKSFLDGPFRESCGADFYDGHPVRPATLNLERETVADLEIIGFHNTLADGPYPLHGACRRIRGLWKQRINPKLPTDPQGNLGFRPINCAYYTLVETDGRPHYSKIWQRPRTYILDVRAKYGDLGKVDAWTQIAVALLRARQEGESAAASKWSLPLRNLTTVRVVPEKDTTKEIEITRLRNTLAHLAVWKDTDRKSVV